MIFEESTLQSCCCFLMEEIVQNSRRFLMEEIAEESPKPNLTSHENKMYFECYDFLCFCVYKARNVQRSKSIIHVSGKCTIPSHQQE